VFAIRLDDQTVDFDSERLRLSPQFFRLYCFLALVRHERPEGWVELVEILQVRGWEKNQPKSIGKQISRHLRRKGVTRLIEAVEKTKGPYRLAVPGDEITFDRPIEDVKADLAVAGFESFLTVQEEERFFSFVRHLWQAQSLMDSGRLVGALNGYAEAEQEAITAQQRAAALLRTARILERMGRYEEAETVLERAQDSSLESGEFRTWLEATTLTLRAWIRYRRNRHTEAEKLYQRARGLIAGKGHYRILGDIYNGLAQIQAFRRDREKAVLFYTRALEYWALTDYSYGVQAIYHNTGQLYANRAHDAEAAGDEAAARHWYQKSKEWIERCIEMTTELEIAFDTTADRIRLARLYLRFGELDKALAEALRAKENARRSGNLRDLAMAYEAWILVLRAAGRKPEVAAAFAELRTRFDDAHFRAVVREELHRLEPRDRRWVEKVLQSFGQSPGPGSI